MLNRKLMKWALITIFLTNAASIAIAQTPNSTSTKPAVSAPEEPNVATKSTDQIYTEDKQNIAVNSKHPQFVIKLKSNPTTGYSWFLREYDPTLVMPVKHVLAQSTNKALMGAPSYELWTFKIKPNAFIVPHQTTIRMVYARPWQGSESATQLVFRVTTMMK